MTRSKVVSHGIIYAKMLRIMFYGQDTFPTEHQMNNSRSTFASSNSAFMDYPTFKLDRNTVVDTSMKWERWVSWSHNVIRSKTVFLIVPVGTATPPPRRKSAPCQSPRSNHSYCSSSSNTRSSANSLRPRSHYPRLGRDCEF